MCLSGHMCWKIKKQKTNKKAGICDFYFYKGGFNSLHIFLE
ncbi:hypothetical protein IMCC14465_03230 [alpha proteobacterium IMCC14465]|uniref:Uncharacterized protein n=1 Tax=alpha proteobacterium IMCC14465 TaxID=1220535 RepID=J9E206_9PROT|nr:hypothetical protein IMCC14465_03230 [alpha proteobacterium IMCC14465]